MHKVSESSLKFSDAFTQNDLGRWKVGEKNSKSVVYLSSSLADHIQFMHCLWNMVLRFP